MKKIQWTVPIFNLFTLVFFLISAGILSTYETESVLFDEWLYFTLYFILSGIQTMILLFKKNDEVKKVLSILLTALKTYTIWLALSHTQNLGFSTEGIPFYPVLVPTIITVILSIMELFFENAFLLLSDREEESIIGKAKKKTCILFLTVYFLAVVFIIICSSLYLFQIRNIQVYPPFFLIDGKIYPVPLLHDYYWTGLILQASIIAFGILPLTKTYSRKTIRPELTSMLVLVFGSLCSSFLCLFVDQTETKGIIPPTQLVLFLFMIFSAVVLIAYPLNLILSIIKRKKTTE